MIDKKSLVLTASCLLSSQVVIAAVYKTVDEHGNVVYTDDPVGHGEPVKLPPLSTVPPPSYQSPASPAGPAVDEGKPSSVRYQQLKIASPTQDETLRDNPGNVWIKAAINPEFDPGTGDRLQFYLDGKPVGKPDVKDKVLIPDVDRGAHTVSVSVVGPGGKELQRSDDVRFYLHRQSVNFPTRQQAAP